MRTTIRMQDSLLKEAKRQALSRNISLTALIEEALQEKLYQKPGAGAPDGTTEGGFRLITTGGSGARPGVNLDDSAALRDLMDR